MPQAPYRRTPDSSADPAHAPVIVNCRFLTRPVTGVERFAEELVTELLTLRDDLVLVAPKRAELRRNAMGGLPVHRVGRFRGHLWEQTELVRFARSHGGALLLNLANSGPAFTHRQIVAIHDINHRRHPDSYSWRFRSLYGALTPLLVRNAAAVVTVSRFSKQEITDYYGRSQGVVVISNAVGSWVRGARLKPAGIPAGPFFLIVGSPSPHKNMSTAITGFRQYRGSGGTARLVVAGASHVSLAETRVAATEGMWTPGRVTDEELSWLYAHCRAFIFPSIYEGFGIPPLEAQAAGAPVLAADIPALREALAPESALWFPPEDAARLAWAMSEVEDDARAASLKKMGRVNVERFSWSASAIALSELIDSVRGQA